MGRSARGPRIDRKSVGNKSAENPFDLIDSQIPDMGVIVMSQQLQVSLVVVSIFTWTKMQYVREDFQEVLSLGSLNCHESDCHYNRTHLYRDWLKGGPWVALNSPPPPRPEGARMRDSRNLEPTF